MKRNLEKLLTLALVVLALILFMTAPAAWATDVVLEWTHPSPEMVDGYKIYHGDVSGAYLAPEDVGAETTLDPGHCPGKR